MVLKKVLVVAMVIMFIDAIIQDLTGGILLQDDTYTLVELIFLLIELVLTFMAVIIHAITHLNDVGSDIVILITGLMSLIMFVFGSVIDLLLHFIRMPFEWIGSMVTSFGFYIDLWAFGNIIIDFKSLSWAITLPSINEANIWGSGVWIVMENTIGFSLLGASDLTPSLISLDITNLGSLGESVTKELPSGLSGFISIDISMNDYIFGSPIGIGDTYIGIVDTGINASLEGLFRALVDSLAIPKLVDWIGDTWVGYGLSVLPSDSSFIQFIKYKIEQVINVCQRKSLMVYHGKIFGMVSF